MQEPLRQEKADWQKLNERISTVAGYSTYITTDPGPFDQQKATAWSSGGSIYLRPKAAEPLMRLKRGWVAPPPGAGRRRSYAESIYTLAHEVGHLDPDGGDPEKIPDPEKRANSYAAKRFFYFAERFGLDRRTANLLWRSLPDSWRNVK